MVVQELNEGSLAQDPEVIEINLLLEAIYQRYGYDFRDYGKAHAKRRILHRLALSGITSISELQHRILYDESIFHLILQDLSINTTEMFRDPEFFLSVREQVIPVLKTYPFIKIWHAGCSTGEEVYSMAILLREEGLLNRTQIYATDFNPSVLQKAREAIYSATQMKEYTRNYIKSGGKYSFSDYYNARYDSAILKKALKENVVFADHNLVTDSVFGEMNLIMCRNTLIYFNKRLQDKVIGLFCDSLVPGGFLCLGSKESITFSPYKENFEPVVGKWKIFRKKY
jgi:chemotaxis protein methyltransferase CheR